jgi:hypothetical protein
MTAVGMSWRMAAETVAGKPISIEFAVGSFFAQLSSPQR